MLDREFYRERLHERQRQRRIIENEYFEKKYGIWIAIFFGAILGLILGFGFVYC